MNKVEDQNKKERKYNNKHPLKNNKEISNNLYPPPKLAGIKKKNQPSCYQRFACGL